MVWKIVGHGARIEGEREKKEKQMPAEAKIGALFSTCAISTWWRHGDKSNDASEWHS